MKPFLKDINGTSKVEWIEKIQDLKKELNISEETLQRFEDKILKKHQKIEKLVE